MEIQQTSKSYLLHAWKNDKMFIVSDEHLRIKYLIKNNGFVLSN